jgi:hypothetical protein
LPPKAARARRRTQSSPLRGADILVCLSPGDQSEANVILSKPGVILSKSGVILSKAGVILSKAGVILSEAKDLRGANLSASVAAATSA